MSSTKAAPCCSAFDFSFLSTAISSSAPMALAEIASGEGLPTVKMFMSDLSADAQNFCSHLFSYIEPSRAIVAFGRSCLHLIPGSIQDGMKNFSAADLNYIFDAQLP